MPTPVSYGSISVDLQPCPITPEWILEGNPVARKGDLSRSHDGTACTVVWDCTPGKFRWHYTCDETIHILEGQIVLDDGVAPPRRLGPSDVVFFPAGAVVHWTVETHVRKLAFLRALMPRSAAFTANAVRRAKSLIRPRRQAEAALM